VLTISELAAYAGVTVRAVRHYHAKGLLPEPERDQSGYRRYDAEAVVELIKIRTLADAGVPLSRVEQLLAADDEEFAAAVEDIDRRLRAEILERQHHRAAIRKLASGDSLALPPEAVAYVERLRELELPQQMIDLERDAWILVAAQMPQEMAFFMELKTGQIELPAVIKLYRDLAEALQWPLDDPRFEALADHLVGLFEAGEEAAAGMDEVVDISDEMAELLDGVFYSTAPYARRLEALIQERGWTGWTKVKRIEPSRRRSLVG
jgi:DNA-binding transcriptional MerR regulator